MKQSILILLMAFVLLFPGVESAAAEELSHKKSDEKVVVQPNRPTISELKIRGRIQGQFAYSDGSNDNTGVDAGNYSSFEMRRVRFGAQGKIQGNWNFMVEANVLSSVSLDAATLTYAANPAALVTFGKAKPRFGMEQNTSSASILTFERTLLDAHLNGGKPLGLRVHGSAEAFTYYVGVYNGQSVGTGRMAADSDSYLLNASLGLQAGRLFNNDIRLDFRADYLHSTDVSGYYAFENAFAVSGRFGLDQFDLRAEFMTGTSHNDLTVSGFYVMPSYFIVPNNLQAVLRFESVSADTGVALGQNRYADRVPSLYGGGDDYYAVYAGVNYYVFGDNLKFMFGAELAENSGAADASGQAITILSGFRMQF